MDFTSQYYLTESFQQLLNVFGKNCIVEGLNIKNLSYNNSSETGTNIVSFTLSKGKCIVDSSLIEFDQDISLYTDSNFLLSNEKITLLVVVTFRYLRTPRKNLAAINIKLLNDNNVCSNWDDSIDNLILTTLEFDGTGSSNIVNIIESDIYQQSYITINNKDYEIRPYSTIFNDFRRLYNNI